jgi:uncharacterized MnhB-related membrane protein
MSSIEESVTAMIPRMTQEIAAKIQEQALANIRHTTAQAISDEVTKYVAEIVMPLVRSELLAQQDDIKAAILAASRGVADALAEHLVRHATVKLASYEGDKILERVFGPLFRGY